MLKIIIRIYFIIVNGIFVFKKFLIVKVLVL